jgi:hypothetical protein
MQSGKVAISTQFNLIGPGFIHLNPAQMHGSVIVAGKIACQLSSYYFPIASHSNDYERGVFSAERFCQFKGHAMQFLLGLRFSKDSFPDRHEVYLRIKLKDSFQLHSRHECCGK